MNILIPNYSSPKNLGDQAILEATLNFFNANYPDAIITIHSYEPQLVSYPGIKKNYTIYSWAVFKNRNAFVRIWRLLQALLAYLSGRFGLVFIPYSGELGEIINDYKNADIIFFVGGGYFRAKKGITQILNNLMLLWMIKFSKIWGGRVLVGPISFGPYAQRFLEKWTANALKAPESVFIREAISAEKIEKFNLENIVESYDSAFLHGSPLSQTKDKKLIGFTFRQWLNNSEEKKLQEEFIEGLIRFAREEQTVIQPIVQVTSTEYGDMDIGVMENFAGILKERGLGVNPVKILHNLDEAWQTYGQLAVLVGMRMHSNILAALAGTPFVAVSYEHKTEGIVKQLGMESYCLALGDITKEKVYVKLKNCYKNQVEIGANIATKIGKIRSELKLQMIKAINIRRRDTPVLSVTVGIAAYNAERNIGDMIEAVLGQNSPNFRLEKLVIHCDECSDNTVVLAKAFKDTRIEIIETKPRQGFAAAFIKLLGASKSDITLLLNDDIKIENANFISHLVKPFNSDEGIGLVCGNPLPFPGTNFIMRAVESSEYAWYRMRDQLKQGNNAFTVDGKIMAFSAEFKDSMVFPKTLGEMGNVDAYVYLLCKKLNFGYNFAREAVANYKNPSTLHDHLSWATRNNSHHAMLPKQFGEIFYPEHKKPLLLYISCLAMEFVKNPSGSAVIFFGSFYIRYKASQYSKDFKQTWEVVGTSKI